MPHPLRHQVPADLDAVAQVDRLLPVERKTVAIFREDNIGQQPLRRQAAFDDVRWRQRLDHAVMAPEGIFGAARHDDSELRRHDIQALGPIPADQNLFQPDIFGGDFRLNDLLDAYEMGGKALARTRRALRLVAARAVKLTLDRRKTRLDLLEGKGHLLVIHGKPQPLRSGAILRALQDVHDRRQVGDPLFGCRLHRLQTGDFRHRSVQSGRIPAGDFGMFAHHCLNHRRQRINIVRQFGNGQNHGGNRAQNALFSNGSSRF